MKTGKTLTELAQELMNNASGEENLRRLETLAKKHFPEIL